MTYQEAIEILKKEMIGDSEQMEYAKQIAVGVIEKQTPKKPIEARRWLYDNILICPVCSCSIYKLSFSYCPNCGQKIDWEKQ